MRPTIISVTLALATWASAAPTVSRASDPSSFIEIPSRYATGFKNPTIQFSSEGRAICIEGMIDVAASAENLAINIPQPTNHTVVTELTVEAFQINSTLAERVITGHSTVSGTYGIHAQLCYPKTGLSNGTIQFLIPGIGFDRNYWNFAPGYSYVDSAASHGYTTFTFDRLGTGFSDKPDPIQIVQFNLQVEIAHQLIRLLRQGVIAGQKFQSIVGVGHSFGSLQTLSITAKYPADLDAAVLTGLTLDVSGMPVAFASTNLVIASENDPYRFSSLPSGYLTANSVEGAQSFFFRWPGFDPAILNLAQATRQTIAIGEFLSQNMFPVAENFTGPIDVVVGENDLPNCHGNCLVPTNKPAAVKDALYPKASNGSSWYIAPNAGHGLNFHYSAAGAYEHIQDFVKKNGF